MNLSKELRVGNYVKKPRLTDNIVYEISSGHDIEEIEEGEIVEPIPIDEHWLLLFGFTMEYKTEIATKYFLGNNIYQMQFDEHSGWQFLFYNKPISCKYIHILQNLYFFLSGEELKVKEQLKE